MTLEELKSRLEAGRETPSFEVKGPMIWHAPSLAKDILALANVKDGGYIVIGVKDESFSRLGVSLEVKKTYQEETMKDQMAAYADPHVSFSVDILTDATEGKDYIVIQVEPFKRIPVICQKDSSGTSAGVIYYRTSRGRTQSSPISNAYDMEEVIMMALSRSKQHFSDLGIEIEDTKSLEQKFLDELGDL